MATATATEMAGLIPTPTAITVAEVSGTDSRRDNGIIRVADSLAEAAANAGAGVVAAAAAKPTDVPARFKDRTHRRRRQQAFDLMGHRASGGSRGRVACADLPERSPRRKRP